MRAIILKLNQNLNKASTKLSNWSTKIEIYKIHLCKILEKPTVQKNEKYIQYCIGIQFQETQECPQ